ncbi:MAG: hypothetical protein HKN47_28325 [Pirellulaceae bacterium]|nr:hypothetical protein [Pirellulaceae bacterium]
MTNSPTRSNTKRFRQFSIAGLLLLMCSAAGFFVGFRYGLGQGVDDQVKQRLADQQSIRYVKNYLVGPLLQSKSPLDNTAVSLETLQRDLEQAVCPGRWQSAGGESVIAAVPPASLIISASATDHDQVAAYLAGRQHVVSLPR